MSEAYEGKSNDGTVDFHIRKEKGVYMVDLFDASEEDAEDAFIDTTECDTLEEAQAFAREATHDGK